MARKNRPAADPTTEEKIKSAARKVFTQKGYSAARTRDIAEEAGINLALLNYYFRSKQKLFDQIMMEKVQQLFGRIVPVLMDKTTSLDMKVKRMVSHYIHMLTENPDLPIFVLSEIRAHPDHFVRNFQLADVFTQSAFIQQLNAKYPSRHPLHFMMNIFGMTLFPFVAKPLFQTIAHMSDDEFTEMMTERETLIPLWNKAILQTK